MCDTTTVPSSIGEGTTIMINPQNKNNKNNTDETVQEIEINETYDISNFEEGYPMVFDMDDEEILNHDHASDQEEEEPLYNNEIHKANDMPIRQTKQPALLTFDFNSKDR
jgi:hypothetical protein